MLTSEVTGLTSKPTFLSMGLLKDREPRVILRAQGVGGHVTPVATIPLTMAATDDLGLARLRLQVERTVQDGDKAEPVTTKPTVAIPLATDAAAGDPRPPGPPRRRPPGRPAARRRPPPPHRRGRGPLRQAEPRSGGRASSTSRSSRADELFYEILIRQRAERAKFVAAYDAAAKLKPTLAGTPTVEDFTGASRALHTGTRQLELIAGRISDSLAEMKLNQVGSPKSHRLLQDGVIDPILALNAGAGERAPGDPAGPGRGLEGAGGRREGPRRHGEVVARMKVILDQMSQWESFVDVVNQVAEVIKIQQNVLKATENARDSRTQEVFDGKP